MFRLCLILLLILVFLLPIGCKKMSDTELLAQANQYNQEGKYEEAISAFQKLIDNYPKSPECPEAQFMIGYIFANSIKDLDKAKEAYEKFLKIYPNDDLATSTRWELDNLGKEIDDIEMLIQNAQEASADTLDEEQETEQ